MEGNGKLSAREWAWIAAVILAASALAVKLVFFPGWNPVRDGLTVSRKAK